MLRSVLFVYCAVLLAMIRSQPIPKEASSPEQDTQKPEEFEIQKPETEMPFKKSDVEIFMEGQADAIRKIISEQKYAIGVPSQHQLSKNPDEHVTFDSSSEKAEGLEEEIKAKCKHYYELFEKKYEELQSKQADLIKNDDKIEPDTTLSNKYRVKINNFETQNLPYPDRQFFNLNPDTTIQKPNSKGPVAEIPPIFTSNGYQYVPLVDSQYNANLNVENTPQNYLQLPYDSKPVEFNKNHQQYMKLSPLALQNSLVSDGKMVYFWYKMLPNYEIYLPVTDDSNNNKYEEKASTIYEDTSSTTTTSTTEATTTIEPTTTLKFTKLEEPKQNIYEHQLKFVFPIQYPKENVANVPIYDIDPYTYYPRELQPDFMNVQVPYMPTYYMIKRLTVPNE